MTAYRIRAWSKALAAGVSAIIRSIAASLRALEREAELRSAERALEALPDLVLKDIGLSRGSISHHVRTSRGRRTMDRPKAAGWPAAGSEHPRIAVWPLPPVSPA